MAIINKTGITEGSTIQAEHVTRAIDALSGGSTDTIVATGSFSGSFTGLLNGGVGITITGNTSSYVLTATGNSDTIAGSSKFQWDGSSVTIIGAGGLKQGEGNFSSNFGHAQGSNTTASGNYSHAEGVSTIARAAGSHAEGLGTIASGSYQHVEGQYNTQGDTTSLLIVGNGGGAPLVRSDAFKVRMSGSIVLPTTQSAAPTWTGTDGEMVFATVGGVHRMYLYMSGAWRSASFA